MNVPHSLPQAGEPGLAGDPALLRDCLGSPEGLGTLGLALGPDARHAVTDGPSLRAFVESYRNSVLLPRELPAIRAAYGHAARYELRELLDLDRGLAHESTLADFAFASQVVGRNYLRRLRPLRDLRLVRRYEQAVVAGNAHGWHTLVFGVVLTVYSLPLRQGLIGYARQTLSGFVQAGASRLGLKVAERTAIEAASLSGLPQSVNAVVDASLQCLPNLAPWST